LSDSQIGTPDLEGLTVKTWYPSSGRSVDLLTTVEEVSREAFWKNTGWRWGGSVAEKNARWTVRIEVLRVKSRQTTSRSWWPAKESCNSSINNVLKWEASREATKL
jgi:hypothetical protein